MSERTERRRRSPRAQTVNVTAKILSLGARPSRSFSTVSLPRASIDVTLHDHLVYATPTGGRQSVPVQSGKKISCRFFFCRIPRFPRVGSAPELHCPRLGNVGPVSLGDDTDRQRRRHFRRRREPQGALSLRVHTVLVSRTRACKRAKHKLASHCKPRWMAMRTLPKRRRPIKRKNTASN